ncbi:MAG: hypothetical protein KDA21_14480, partial [Phycisphaerales bacterium]|nr:hypothetical protein [Phycisphaerales bacterium]
MPVDRVAMAAENNARWCDAVCRAHGCRCEFVTGAWLCHGTPPPYHSNLVTLGGPEMAAVHADLIRARVEDPGVGSFGFKDSFGCVDVPRAGGDRRFDVLFEASWIWLEAEVRLAGVPGWSRVDDAAGLRAFERAWRGDDANSAASATAQFPESLLRDPGVAFLTGVGASGEVEGVAIVNRTGRVAGLSNVFGPAMADDALWQGA